MDKLTIISGCLFLAADIFAIASIANPDWINTGESAGLRCCTQAFSSCGYILHEKRDVLCLTAVSQYPEECLAHRRHLDLRSLARN
ncbi:modulator of smoothened protein isoform X4 [Ovis aries]|uniref:modulator of smoothened protein isoform X4 n=1 Tax=Ovis aries TaxID=9940 RepID=UPI00295287EF|nr:modulator of smoothened protein isoform X4 [Ovis aries]